ncbi:hypothetical protein CVT26_013396 [Gymnopilus dilepis]|uniref:F-box domain-containing protein n=1 Tax=Gymnopilus dilepis TaxID=231916 RepID=A0A409VV35_9AGAR|nr:hypothetical protein CVT26_013396 [Gymnopilus dilepis]
MTLPSTLDSLPTEVLLLILDFCNFSSLITLAQTCKYFNQTALDVFYRRCKAKPPRKGWLGGYLHPKEKLDAARLSLQLYPLRKLTWSFNPGYSNSEVMGGDFCKAMWMDSDHSIPCLPDWEKWGITGPFQATLDEIQALRRVVMHYPPIHEVQLNFTLFDRWLRHLRLPESMKMGYGIWQSFFELLKELLDGGCRELHIRGGGQVMETLFSAAGERGELDVLEGLFFSSDFRPCIPAESKLTRLVIASEIFFQPPFLEWTTRLFSSHDTRFLSSFPTKVSTPFKNASHLYSPVSSTLTSLSLSAATSSDPERLLNALNLSNLVDFSLKLGKCHTTGAHRIAFEDLASFLARHEKKLENLTILGACSSPTAAASHNFRSSLKQTELRQSVDSREAACIFQKLEKALTYPLIMTWLLSLPICTQPSPPLAESFDVPSNFAHEESFGHLKSMELVLDLGMVQTFPIYSAFDEVLPVISRFCEWRASNSSKAPKPELVFQFEDESEAHQWFEGYLLNNPPTEPSPVSALRELKYISTIGFAASCDISFANETFAIIPDWLALVGTSARSGPDGSFLESGTSASTTLSSLQQIKIVDFVDFPLEDFARRIAEHPGLKHVKWLEVNSIRTIDLDREWRRKMGSQSDSEAVRRA